MIMKTQYDLGKLFRIASGFWIPETERNIARDKSAIKEADIPDFDVCLVNLTNEKVGMR